MGSVSNELRSIAGGSLAFWCPGCKEAHVIGIGDGPAPRWSYNGSPDAPTFSPSVFVTSGHYSPGAGGKDCWCTYRAQHPDDIDAFECSCCHSFVTDGRIQFLDDCTHELRGQTVDLPNWPERGSGT